MSKKQVLNYFKALAKDFDLKIDSKVPITEIAQELNGIGSYKDFEETHNGKFVYGGLTLNGVLQNNEPGIKQQAGVVSENKQKEEEITDQYLGALFDDDEIEGTFEESETVPINDNVEDVSVNDTLAETGSFDDFEVSFADIGIEQKEEEETEETGIEGFSATDTIEEEKVEDVAEQDEPEQDIAVHEDEENVVDMDFDYSAETTDKANVSDTDDTFSFDALFFDDDLENEFDSEDEKEVSSECEDNAAQAEGSFVAEDNVDEPEDNTYADISDGFSVNEEDIAEGGNESFEDIVGAKREYQESSDDTEDSTNDFVVANTTDVSRDSFGNVETDSEELEENEDIRRGSVSSRNTDNVDYDALSDFVNVGDDMDFEEPAFDDSVVANRRQIKGDITDAAALLNSADDSMPDIDELFTGVENAQEVAGGVAEEKSYRRVSRDLTDAAVLLDSVDEDNTFNTIDTTMDVDTEEVAGSTENLEDVADNTNMATIDNCGTADVAYTNRRRRSVPRAREVDFETYGISDTGTETADYSNLDLSDDIDVDNNGLDMFNVGGTLADTFSDMNPAAQMLCGYDVNVIATTELIPTMDLVQAVMKVAEAVDNVGKSIVRGVKGVVGALKNGLKRKQGMQEEDSVEDESGAEVDTSFLEEEPIYYEEAEEEELEQGSVNTLDDLYDIFNIAPTPPSESQVNESVEPDDCESDEVPNAIRPVDYSVYEASDNYDVGDTTEGTFVNEEENDNDFESTDSGEEGTDLTSNYDDTDDTENEVVDNTVDGPLWSDEEDTEDEENKDSNSIDTFLDGVQDISFDDID